VLQRVSAVAGAQDEIPRDGLTQAVRATLNPPDHVAGIFGGHLARLRTWNVDSAEPPPVIALLGVLCLAAEDMREGDGFAANNYYDRLMPLLGVASPDKNRVINAYRRCSSEL